MDVTASARPPGPPPPRSSVSATSADRPARAEGIELIGEYEGSGFKEPPSLARRADGQVIQLTPLLYAVAERADGRHDLAQIAELVGHQIGRRVTADNIRVLVDDRLRPLGVLAAADGSSPPVRKLDPFLGLKFRTAVIPERVSRGLGSAFRLLFLPPLVLAALAGLAVTDYWVFFHHGVAQALRQALYEPSVFLIGFAAVVVGAAFHEIGHATGCRYGGAEPGRMGCGLYLAWPAFYTDVTDAYRLGRRGRLRTDLGGVYFNTLFVLATIGLYALTHWEPLLLLIVVQHLEIAHQLLPIVRLDGYYIVADLTGVPDLFARIKPILLSLLPGRKADDRVTVLKPWVRVAVTAWVLIVVPVLMVQLLVILVQLPRILGTAWDSLGRQTTAISAGLSNGHLLDVVTGSVQIIVLALPILAILLMMVRLGQSAVAGVWRRTEGRPVLRVLAVALIGGAAGLLVYVWVPKGDYRPIRRDERGTLQQGVAAVNPANVGRLHNFVPPPDLKHPASTTTVPATTSTTLSRTTPTTRARSAPPTTVAATVPRTTVRPTTTTTVPRATTTTG